MKHLITGCFLILLWIPILQATGDTVAVNTEFRGHERSYVLYIPDQQTPDRPWPVVLDFHGYAMEASLHMRISRMHNVADTGQFVVVYPQSQLVDHDGKMILNWSLETNPEEDVAFIEQILQEVEQAYLIDPDRIYATGWNTGGMMCYQLACALSDKLAAIATVGGTATRTQVCRPQPPLPVLYVQATLDPLSNYQFNWDSYELLSVQEYLNLWLDQNHCDATSTRQVIAAPDSLDVFAGEEESWSDCQAAVLRYRPWEKKSLGALPELDEALHETTSAKIWSFFREHSNTSFTTSIPASEENLTSITLFPNPVHDRLTVHGFLAKAGTITMSIRSSNGQQIYQNRMNIPAGPFIIRHNLTEQVPNGLYYLILRSNDQVTTRKLVRQEP